VEVPELLGVYGAARPTDTIPESADGAAGSADALLLSEAELLCGAWEEPASAPELPAQAAKPRAPTIVSESGRAVASYQSVLIFSAVAENQERAQGAQRPDEQAPRVVHELWDVFENIMPKNVQESWHDANQALEEARSLFRFGYISLRDLAHAETLFWACCERIRERMQSRGRIPEELENLDDLLGHIYYCNFSLFQSAPDIWAMDQLFPIMPIHKLQERPTNKARLAD